MAVPAPGRKRKLDSVVTRSTDHSKDVQAPNWSMTYRRQGGQASQISTSTFIEESIRTVESTSTGPAPPGLFDFSGFDRSNQSELETALQEEHEVRTIMSDSFVQFTQTI